MYQHGKLLISHEHTIIRVTYEELLETKPVQTIQRKYPSIHRVTTVYIFIFYRGATGYFMCLRIIHRGNINQTAVLVPQLTSECCIPYSQ